MPASPAYVSPRALPLPLAVALAVAAIILVAADVLPANGYVDPDALEFSLSVALAGSAIAIALRERMDRAAVHRLGLRFVLAVLTLGISSAAAEIATRWLFRDVTTTADNRGFFSRRWYRQNPAVLNAAGFRGRPFATEKPAGVFRVAVVGDSFTYGNGIRSADRFTDVMQARLPEHIEVLNFGRAGDNTPQHLDLGDGCEFGYLHDRVLAICAEQRIRCLDLRKDFAVVKDRQQLWANRLDHHPSALANAIAANRILETFAADWTKEPCEK